MGREALALKVLILHGPNLNLLGHREPQHYGHQTLEAIDAGLRSLGEALGVEVSCRQTNREGDLVEWLHEAMPAASGGGGAFDAVVLNPAGYAHTSVVLADAVAAAVASGLPVVEVHLSNVHDREAFRSTLLSGAAASGVVSGLGAESYMVGLQAAVRLAERQ